MDSATTRIDVFVLVLDSRAVHLLAFLFLIILLLCADHAIAAQLALTADAHIQPRSTRSQPAFEDKPSSSPAPEPKPIIKDVDLVLLPASITDQANRPVLGIQKSQIEVFDNGKPQEIQHLSNEEGPVSVAIVLDISGSMARKTEDANEAVSQFLRTANSQDEFLIVTCSEKPQLLGGFDQDVETTGSQLLYQVSKGRTALIDSIYLAMSKLKTARYARKAILVISDGGDNHSRYTEGELNSLVKEADVQIYAIGIYENGWGTPEERHGPALLHDLANASGGRDFLALAPDDFRVIGKQIGIMLRNQYVIAYKPTNVPRDGKWHKIKLKLLLEGAHRLVISSRHGYYSPKQR